MTRRLARQTLLLVAFALCAQTSWAQQPSVVTWKVGADSRQGIVYPPTARAASGKSPLVLSFHGYGDNMQNFQHTDLHRVWPEAVVVYFQGVPSRTGGLPGWQTEKGQNDDEDLKLVDVALAWLKDRYKVDDARIYATGFSNGANFTYLLWAERPGVFAAYAPVAARLRPSVRPREPHPLLHIAGARDRQIPFEDQQDAIEIAKSVNGVAGPGTFCGSGCTLFGSSTASPVMTWIHPGGHEYPEGTSDRIVKFFKEHARQS